MSVLKRSPLSADPLFPDPPKPFLTPDQVAAQLGRDIGGSVARLPTDRTITYSFHFNRANSSRGGEHVQEVEQPTPDNPNPEPPDWFGFNEDIAVIIGGAIEAIDDLLAVDFDFTDSNNSADFRIGASDAADTAEPNVYAYDGTTAELWFGDDFGVDGDVELQDYLVGTENYASFLSYLAEMIGLPEPSRGLDPIFADDANPTYAGDADHFQDTLQYSVRSVFDAENTGAELSASAQTLLLHDILALQRIYGAETTRIGNSVYGYNVSADTRASDAPDFYDFSANLNPVVVIHDSGGIDTLDMSLGNFPGVFNLNQGAFSNINGDRSNVAIAFGTVIENAIGTRGADRLQGNEVDNLLRGNNGSDEIFGAAGDDTLRGEDGNDILVGNAGDDILNGGLGGDAMNGGLGNDIYRVDNASDRVLEPQGDGIDRVEATASVTLGRGIENLTLTGRLAINGTGNALENSITGNSSANRLDGGLGEDRLAGAGGNDTYLIDSPLDLVVERAGGGNDSILADFVTPLPAEVENYIYTGEDSVRLNGTDAANRLRSGAGDDRLDGRSGADAMVGGFGNDLYFVDDAGDRVYERRGLEGGEDEIQSTVSMILPEAVEVLRLIGARAVAATGNAQNNVLIGNAGNNILDGGAGIDAMRGGRGDDIYVVDTRADRAIELAGEGQDTIQTAITIGLAASIENLIATGSANIEMFGNDTANIITGNRGDNRLAGRGGNDILTGRDGEDDFVFNAVSGGRDRITDFERGEDRIVIDEGSAAQLRIRVVDGDSLVSIRALTIIVQDVTGLTGDDFRFI